VIKIVYGDNNMKIFRKFFIATRFISIILIFSSMLIILSCGIAESDNSSVLQTGVLSKDIEDIHNQESIEGLAGVVPKQVSSGTGKFTYFLSDLHIGRNFSSNWYHVTDETGELDINHQGYLKAVLKYIELKEAQVQDVVILGDWFDLWMYDLSYDSSIDPLSSHNPPTVAEIVDGNSGVFQEQLDGDFISVIKKIGGKLLFLNGNHDMSVTVSEINEALGIEGDTKRVYSANGESDPIKNNFYKTDYLYAEHGNDGDLFNEPYFERDNPFYNDEYLKYHPIGYCVSRLTAEIVNKELSEKDFKYAAQLENLGDPGIDFKHPSDIIEFLENVIKGGHLGQNLLKYLMDYIPGLINDDDKMRIPDDLEPYTNFSIGDLVSDSLGFYDDLFHYYDLADWDKLIHSTNDGINEQGEKLLVDHDVVIFGHTHDPVISQPGGKSYPAYVNSGYMCPDKPGVLNGDESLTFVEVEDRGAYLRVSLKKVVSKDDGSYQIEDYDKDRVKIVVKHSHQNMKMEKEKDFVSILHSGAMGIDATEDDLNYWAVQLIKRDSAGVVRDFYKYHKRPWFFETPGFPAPLSNENFVRALYKGALGKELENDVCVNIYSWDFTNWCFPRIIVSTLCFANSYVSNLDSGISREVVLDRFLASEEFKKRSEEFK
jgi:UDP-2,3-diacylglucosamine hydrolase